MNLVRVHNGFLHLLSVGGFVFMIYGLTHFEDDFLNILSVCICILCICLNLRYHVIIVGE